MSNFQGAKSCLKKAIRLFQEHSQQGETEVEQRKLDKGTHIHSFSLFSIRSIICMSHEFHNTWQHFMVLNHCYTFK